MEEEEEENNSNSKQAKLDDEEKKNTRMMQRSRKCEDHGVLCWCRRGKEGKASQQQRLPGGMDRKVRVQRSLRMVSGCNSTIQLCTCISGGSI